MLDHPNNKNLFIQVWSRLIANNKVSILVICYLFIVYGIYSSYAWRSMYALIKENMIIIYNEH